MEISGGVIVGGLLALVVICIFISANLEVLVEASKAKRLAELEVKRLEAEHALRCPRLGDIPRKAKSE